MIWERLQGFGLLMAFFMLLAAPFAAMLLSSWARERFSAKRRLMLLLAVIFLLPAAAAGLLPEMLKWGYLKFIDRDQAYYEQFSSACRDVIRAHPIGTNECIFLPVNDPSVSAAIKRLRPDDMRLWQRGLEIRIGLRGRFGYLVSWFHDVDATNVWRLKAGGGEAPEVFVYAVTNK